MGGVYHVVCHDCPFEGLYETAAEAVDAVETHSAENGHRVSQLEISRPQPTA